MLKYTYFMFGKFGSINKNYLFYLFVFVIVAIGIYVRVRFYLSEQPMWIDEIMLASSFMERSLSDFFLPLDAFQKAPPLFVFLILVVKKIFGASVLSLRLIPFICSILSIFGFFFLLKNNIKNEFGIIAGMSMFTFCLPIVYFSAEFKPYGCDVFICIVLLLLYKYFNFEKISLKQLLVYILGTLFFVFLSYPAILLIPALIFSKMYKSNSIDKKILWIFLAIFAAILLLFLSDLNTYIFLKNYWGNIENGFSVYPSLDFIKTFICSCCEYYIYNYNPQVFYAVIILIFGGFLIIYKENKEKSLLIFLIMIFAIIASLINAYPLKPKLALYMFPIFLLLIVKFYDLKINSKLLNVILSIFLLFIFGVNIPYINVSENDLIFYNKLSDGRNKSIEDRSAVRDYCLKIIQNYKNGDIILASEEFIYSIKCYKAYLRINKNFNIISYAGISDKLVTEIDMYSVTNNIIRNKNSSVWIIGRNDEEYFKCPNFGDIKNIIDKYNLKYEKFVHDDLYLFVIY